ncbi:MAG: SMC-Scp complex subunit ScpB [Gemmatimonadetes bacterium]|nr:MAG: SMC-Scp complex subunit ScpB [Gemmatimonadota bacterium]
MLTPLEQTIEALLFAADNALKITDLHQLLEDTSAEAIRAAIQSLNRHYADHAFSIVEVGEGYRLMTKPAFSEWVAKLYTQVKNVRLSPAALETLAIIAYKQPISRAEIAHIRGVDSSGVIRKLLELNLIEIQGKSDDVGRPLLYGTTPKFLEHFGLRDLAELPSVDELEELLREEPTTGEKLRLGSLFVAPAGKDTTP